METQIHAYDRFQDEDSFQSFETLLGFPCEGVVDAWEWENTQDGLITEAFLGRAPAFMEMIRMAEKLRGTTASVLITGESGTGKELLAHYLHKLEAVTHPRRPFVAVNCAAIPENLIESELFGHEKGSFTDAKERKIGKFELADGGDIFLDEISTLSPALQVKLLRVLQEHAITRVGGDRSISLEFRVIAASNDNIEQLVAEGKFRLDLYHRLCVIPLKTPPLRERREDIPLLAEYFLKKYQGEKKNLRLTPAAVRCLKEYNWPGNVRQLENIMHRTTALTGGEIISGGEILKYFHPVGQNGNGSAATSAPCLNPFHNSEKETLLRLLKENQWNVSKTAKELNMSRTTIYNMMKRHGISR